jgi:hypothetical protein
MAPSISVSGGLDDQHVARRLARDSAGHASQDTTDTRHALVPDDDKSASISSATLRMVAAGLPRSAWLVMLAPVGYDAAEKLGPKAETVRLWVKNRFIATIRVWAVRDLKPDPLRVLDLRSVRQRPLTFGIVEFPADSGRSAFVGVRRRPLALAPQLAPQGCAYLQRPGVA